MRSTKSKARWLESAKKWTPEEHAAAKAWLHAKVLEADPFHVVGWCDVDKLVHVPGIACPACGVDDGADSVG